MSDVFQGIHEEGQDEDAHAAYTQGPVELPGAARRAGGDGGPGPGPASDEVAVPGGWTSGSRIHAPTHQG